MCSDVPPTLHTESPGGFWGPGHGWYHRPKIFARLRRALGKYYVLPFGPGQWYLPYIMRGACGQAPKPDVPSGRVSFVRGGNNMPSTVDIGARATEGIRSDSVPLSHEDQTVLSGISYSIQEVSAGVNWRLELGLIECGVRNQSGFPGLGPHTCELGMNIGTFMTSVSHTRKIRRGHWNTALGLEPGVGASVRLTARNQGALKLNTKELDEIYTQIYLNSTTNNSSECMCVFGELLPQLPTVGLRQVWHKAAQSVTKLSHKDKVL
ncbi:hypothetical protein B0H16DRAFT_1833196 [Mycena metata]|uniref:Uncharacterized protein n=1 Tax=Mycena metata TaxID=1033252 RepID=A0AAD7J060_9AGAR|nr:hypothetical protein B0H16DRAFT_1833196 [Mycena metata]